MKARLSSLHYITVLWQFIVLQRDWASRRWSASRTRSAPAGRPVH